MQEADFHNPLVAFGLLYIFLNYLMWSSDGTVLNQHSCINLHHFFFLFFIEGSDHHAIHGTSTHPGTEQYFISKHLNSKVNEIQWPLSYRFVTRILSNFQILRKEDIEFLVAPYEADAQLAYLSDLEAEKGGIAAVITEDSDLMAYGCQAVRIFTKLLIWANGDY